MDSATEWPLRGRCHTQITMPSRGGAVIRNDAVHSRHLLAHQSCRLQLWHLHIWQVACTHWQYRGQHAIVRAMSNSRLQLLACKCMGSPSLHGRTVDRLLHCKQFEVLTHQGRSVQGVSSAAFPERRQHRRQNCWQPLRPRPGFAAWTDDSSTILPLLKWKP